MAGRREEDGDKARVVSFNWKTITPDPDLAPNPSG